MGGVFCFLTGAVIPALGVAALSISGDRKEASYEEVLVRKEAW